MSSNRRPLFRMGVIDLGTETATLPNGLTLDLAIIRHPGAAAIIALDDRQRLALIYQYRHAVGGWIWEVPAGCKREGESGRQCAERELLEETGLVARQWKQLGAIVTIPSFCDERIELFMASALDEGRADKDDDEVIRVEMIAFERALAMVRSGEIIDAKTIAALHYCSIELQRQSPLQP